MSKVPPNRRFRYKQIHSVEFGLIKMEFVDGVTLSEFVKTEQAKGLLHCKTGGVHVLIDM